MKKFHETNIKNIKQKIEWTKVKAENYNHKINLI